MALSRFMKLKKKKREEIKTHDPQVRRQETPFLSRGISCPPPAVTGRESRSPLTTGNACLTFKTSASVCKASKASRYCGSEAASLCHC